MKEKGRRDGRRVIKEKKEKQGTGDHWRKRKNVQHFCEKPSEINKAAVNVVLDFNTFLLHLSKQFTKHV